MGTSENFCLRWNDFESNVSGAFRELREDSDFFDVTLATSDSGSRTLQAHKVILSACSAFFKQMLRQQTRVHAHPHPFIYLRGVSYNDLLSVLDFMYHGEVNVAQDDLNSFLAVAEELQIKGLTNKDQADSAATPGPSTKSRPVPPARMKESSGPPLKRARKLSPARPKPENDDDDDIKEVSVKVDPDVSAVDEAVNPDEEVYDESYGEYYGDDGSGGLEGEGDDDPTAGGSADGAKELYGAQFHLRANPDGSCRCTTCNQLFKSMTTGRQHVRIVHEPPEFYQCCFCKKIIKTKIFFRSHIYQKHGVRGRDIVNSYGQRVDPPEDYEPAY